MTDVEKRVGTDGPRFEGRRSLMVTGFAVAAAIVIALVAFASRPSNPSAAVPLGVQQTASAWAQQNTQMWSWMRSHWDEMTLVHQHWGDVSWIRENLPDYRWMQEHWSEIAWMHDHWSGMMWMHTDGMMGGV
jgi:hypothetical protein